MYLYVATKNYYVWSFDVKSKSPDTNCLDEPLTIAGN